MDKAEIVARLNNGTLDINGDDLIELAEVMEKRARTPGYQSNTTLRIARELRDAAYAEVERDGEIIWTWTASHD